ncbi:MBL fold metallo-hydrolase [Alicyclobacillus curvatus]|nr:MBL fold metallo-hydrolase [Alicyclobacillus curvatus]
MSRVRFEFHRGIDTIGGTVIVIQCDDHRLIFDMGRIFNPSVPIFDTLNPSRGIGDLQRMGIAPKLPGLFEDGTEAPAGVKTLVAVSHSHLDHVGLLPYLRKDIPVLLHEDTHRLLQALDEVLDGPGQPLDYRPVPSDSLMEFGPFQITVVRVDHDTPGASAFLIATPELKFVYSGDLRLHGTEPALTTTFAEKARAFAPDVLFIEGTRAQSEDNTMMLFETEVSDRLKEAMRDVRAGVYFSFYPRHPERLRAFREAAQATGRTLVVQAPHAYIYERFGGDLTGCAIYGGAEQDWTPLNRSWVLQRGLPVLTLADLKGKEDGYLIDFGYDRFRDWIDIDARPGGLYIHSNGSPLGPFDPAWNNMEAWLNAFGLEFVSVGSTGHGARGDVLSIIDTIRPRVLMPIHSLQPQRIGLKSVKRIMPQYGKVYRASDLLDATYPTERDLLPVKDATRD